jgi:ubiquinone/menaquinone biosynthesis C-methylase UbiE
MRVDQIYERRFQKTETRIELWETLVKYFFQKYIRETDIVLDVPCGYGEFIKAIKCKKKYAVDINPDSEKYLNKDVKFIKAKSSKIPLKARSVDKIFVSNFFEHIPHDEISRTIDEFKRLLKPGGQVLVLQPNIRFAYHNYWMFFDHITPVDDRALDEIFQIKGYKQVHKILKFLPFTSSGRLPAQKFFVFLYLKTRLLWWIMGRQTFVIYEK